ncbi:MAG: SUMF1/EgtB/PvdO family nonheme iron enzyme [Candidatus Competibacteraceae bacterium]|nr:SUMF1/EgtB/PvdO family nonheme iron enzyme [Candidatus Competibacteraceae bacterium]
MSWHRIDERREISTDFVTCAEYQLFLDEKRIQGEYRQPDHWDGEQFPTGWAQKPILGVRGEDADQFCEWLSQRPGNQFRYRLPTLEEISDHPAIVERAIGCWCVAAGKRFVHGFNPSPWKEFFLNALNDDWSYSFTTFARDLDRAHAQALDLARARARDLDLDPDLARARTLDLARARALPRARDLDRIHALARARICARDPDLDRALDRALDFTRTRDLDLARDLARDLDLARAFDFDPARALDFNLARDLDLAHARDLALDRARALALDLARTLPLTSESLSTLRSLCCILIFLWALKIDRDFNPKPTWYKRLWPKRTEADFTHDEQRLDATLDLYAFSLLIDERRKGNLPAWEGIRIVRERLE